MTYVLVMEPKNGIGDGEVVLDDSLAVLLTLGSQLWKHYTAAEQKARRITVGTAVTSEDGDLLAIDTVEEVWE